MLAQYNINHPPTISAMAEVTEHGETDVQPVVKSPCIEIECEHLVCVEGPRGTKHLVIRKPTVETMRRIREWSKSGEIATTRVADCSGLHVSHQPWCVVECRCDYGTCVVTVAVVGLPVFRSMGEDQGSLQQ